MTNLVNVGTAQIANRGFVALAVEAGIVTVIESLVLLAVDKRTLLGLLVDALTEDNKPVGIYPHECHTLIAGQTSAMNGGKWVSLDEAEKHRLSSTVISRWDESF